MNIRIVGVDFPPTHSARQLATQQVSEALDGVGDHVEKTEVYMSDFSAATDGSACRCSAVVYFHSRFPLLVGEDAPRRDHAILRCAYQMGRAAHE